MQRHYERVLESVVRNPEGRMSEIEMMTEEEQAQLQQSRLAREESELKQLRGIRRRSVGAEEKLIAQSTRTVSNEATVTGSDKD